MSANPGTYDFTIYKGTTFSRVFTYKDASGNPIDLTGYSAEFKAKPSPTYASSSIDLTTSPGVVLGGALGTITLTIDATTTAGLNDDQLIYSLKLIKNSVVTALLIGTITVSAEAV